MQVLSAAFSQSSTGVIPGCFHQMQSSNIKLGASKLLLGWINLQTAHFCKITLLPTELSVPAKSSLTFRPNIWTFSSLQQGEEGHNSLGFVICFLHLLLSQPRIYSSPFLVQPQSTSQLLKIHILQKQPWNWWNVYKLQELETESRCPRSVLSILLPRIPLFSLMPVLITIKTTICFNNPGGTIASLYSTTSTQLSKG